MAMRCFLGGEGGIRTLGELPHAGFQDRYLQPLGHLSVTLSSITYIYLIWKTGPRRFGSSRTLRPRPVPIATFHFAPSPSYHLESKLSDDCVRLANHSVTSP